jgi:hypothetical protein
MVWFEVQSYWACFGLYPSSCMNKTMDRIQNKPNSSVQHTPSSESFQVYLLWGANQKFIRKRNNSVSIVTDYGLEFRHMIPDRGRYFCLHYRLSPAAGSTSLLLQCVSGTLPAKVKWPELEDDPWFLSNTEVKNTWNLDYAFHCVFISLCLLATGITLTVPLPYSAHVWWDNKILEFLCKNSFEPKIEHKFQEYWAEDASLVP